MYCTKTIQSSRNCCTKGKETKIHTSEREGTNLFAKILKQKRKNQLLSSWNCNKQTNKKKRIQ
jgi:hypothetical protein